MNFFPAIKTIFFPDFPYFCPMKKSLYNPHDKFFKAMMAEKDIAIDFLKQFLPSEVSALIDYDSLELKKDSFLDDKLREIFADSVIQCRMKYDKESVFYLSVLIEHKSYPDKNVALQLLQYLVNAYQSQMKNEQALHPIVPLLFYHGKQTWAYRSLSGLFPDLKPRLRRYIPDFETVFVDLVRISDTEILEIENIFLHSSLIMQRYTDFPEELPDQLKRILKRFAVEKLSRKNFEQAIFVYFFEISNLKREEFMNLVKTIPKDKKSELMTTYEMIEQIGVEKGIEKGIEQNKVDIILKGHQKGASIEFLADITGLSPERVKEIISQNVES